MNKDISITTASLIAIITFLIGGFFGDWKASYELKTMVLNNAVVANQAKSDIAVIMNSVRGIEKSLDKIENQFIESRQQ